MTVNGEITRPRIKVGRLNTSYVIGVAHTGNVFGNVSPDRTTIATHLHIPVVGADPDNTRHFRRFTDRYDVTITSVAVVLRRHRIFAWHTHDRKRAPIDVFGQVSSGRPGITAIQRLEESIATSVNDARVVWRQHN